MSSKLIKEIKSTHDDPEQPAEQAPEIDYTPMSPAEEQTFDESTNFGELLLQSLAEEIVKPIAEIKIYNIFKIYEVGPIKINSSTARSLLDQIDRKTLLKPQYKHIIPHLYKFVILMPSLAKIEFKHLETATTDPAIPIYKKANDGSSPSNAPAVMQRTRSKSSSSKSINELKSIHALCEPISNSFLKKKIQEMDKYLSAAMKKIEPYLIIKCIQTSLHGLSASNFGENFNITASSSELDITSVIESQVLNPVMEIFKCILIQEGTTLSSDQQRVFTTHQYVQSSADNHQFLLERESYKPDFVVLSSNSEKDTNPSVVHYIEVKKPNLFISSAGSIIDFEQDFIISDIFRQILSYCEKLKLDSFSLTDGVGF